MGCCTSDLIDTPSEALTRHFTLGNNVRIFKLADIVDRLDSLFNQHAYFAHFYDNRPTAANFRAAYVGARSQTRCIGDIIFMQAVDRRISSASYLGISVSSTKDKVVGDLVPVVICDKWNPTFREIRDAGRYWRSIYGQVFPDREIYVTIPDQPADIAASNGCPFRTINSMVYELPHVSGYRYACHRLDTNHAFIELNLLGGYGRPM